MLFSLEVHRFPLGERPRPAVSTRAVQALAQGMLHCLHQLDEFLGTSPHFLLGKWLADARASATSESEKALWEFGARNQLMMWGPQPQVGPNPDYACKDWCAWKPPRFASVQCAGTSAICASAQRDYSYVCLQERASWALLLPSLGHLSPHCGQPVSGSRSTPASFQLHHKST
jgi:hypothetical protein